MVAMPDGWPTGALPLYLPRRWAAYYLGMSQRQFDEEVRLGRLPGPGSIRGRSRWYRPKLEQAVAQIEGLLDPVQTDADQLDREFGCGDGSPT